MAQPSPGGSAAAFLHAPYVLGAFHPSAILRSRNRAEDMAQLVEDLRKAALVLE